MSQKGKESRIIPSVLSIPEKLNGLLLRVLKMRLTLERVFSVRDLLLLLGAFLLFLLRSVIPLPGILSTVFMILILLLAGIPVLLQGIRSGLRRAVPYEEAAVLLAVFIAVLLKKPEVSAVFLLCTVFLWQVEGYCLLHVDAAPSALADIDEDVRNHVLAADSEKSRERSVIAFSAVLFFALFLLLALILAIVCLFHLQNASVWIARSLVPLMLAGTSAVLFSSLLTHFGAIYSTAKAGSFFRNDQVPEDFSRCRLFAFGKTGTVTDGRFLISEIMPVGVTEEELLRIAAVAECKSNHPIAIALKAAAGLKEGVVPSGVLDVREVPGKGVSTFFSGRQIYVGNARLLDEHNIWYQVPSKSGTAIHVAVDSTYRGYILISDSIRDNAFEALEELRAQGVKQISMLTGDVQSVSRVVASALNFDMVKSELTANDKASAIHYLRATQGESGKIAAVGDGVHDSVMFDAADVSVCMDVKPDKDVDLSICTDEILTLPQIYRICRESERTLWISVFGVAGAKLLLCILGLFQVLPLTFLAVFDCAVGTAAVIYSLTCLTLEHRGNRR